MLAQGFREQTEFRMGFGDRTQETTVEASSQFGGTRKDMADLNVINDSNLERWAFELGRSFCNLKSFKTCHIINFPHLSSSFHGKKVSVLFNKFHQQSIASNNHFLQSRTLWVRNRNRAQWDLLVPVSRASPKETWTLSLTWGLGTRIAWRQFHSCVWWRLLALGWDLSCNCHGFSVWRRLPPTATASMWLDFCHIGSGLPRWVSW